MTMRYTVETLRHGQPRPYADHENEYRITVERLREYGPDKNQLKPWVLIGDVEAVIEKERLARAAGRMFGGETPEELRKQQLEWAKALVRTLCQNFREKDDKDGGTGMEAYFYPTLSRLKVDHEKGQITALIIEPYID